MPIDPNTFVTLAMVFPISDLKLTPEQVAKLDEADVSRLSQLVFAVLPNSVDDFQNVMQECVQTVLHEKNSHLN